MAKRKRLGGPLPPQTDSVPADLETKSLSNAPVGVVPTRRAPIADVAGEASATAALTQMATEMDNARREGRMVVTIPLSSVDPHHLLRDRVTLDAGEMDVLKTSLAARGQQTPIEVVQIARGRYGLISGFRRLTALRELHDAGQAPQTVQALIRQPQDAGDAYTAMVEENEIRVGLSHFERASIVVRSVEKGVFPHDKAALSHLFAAASRSKRSKVKSFLPLVRTLGPHMLYPNALGERMGLALAARVADDPDFTKATVKALRNANVQSAEEEAAILQNALTPPKAPAAKQARPAQDEDADHRPGLIVEKTGGPGHIEMFGAALTDEVIDDMVAWLSKRKINVRTVG